MPNGLCADGLKELTTEATPCRQHQTCDATCEKGPQHVIYLLNEYIMFKRTIHMFDSPSPVALHTFCGPPFPCTRTNKYL